jgi:ABC-type dipeptide/oligopeptide/nickel transport system permease subunit
MIMLTVIAANLIGEGLRKRLNPRQQNLLGRGRPWR